ncbi:hypothetical protein BOSEA1005_11094 [Hyphomicrobiales bacterium]|nr:hypothetical protein BOSEA1005_11094 [Hyphomicrobiales bacterium]CAI0347693.1 hypothetical protein BO1005MUT1_90054 [Hyphomicrobiales bacterium]
MSRKGAAPGGENDGVANGLRARIAVDDGATQMHLQAVALGEFVAGAFDGQVEATAQHPDLLVERGRTGRIVEPHFGAGRQFHLDDLEAGAGSARRDVATQIAACGVAPDRLGLAARQRPASCVLFEQRREGQAEPGAEPDQQCGRRTRFAALDAGDHRATHAAAFGESVERQAMALAGRLQALPQHAVDLGVVLELHEWRIILRYWNLQDAFDLYANLAVIPGLTRDPSKGAVALRWIPDLRFASSGMTW